jgi:hypothetical protein
MNKSALLASTAIGLLLCIAPANAQMQQKGSEEKAAPQQGPARARKMDTGEITNSGRSAPVGARYWAMDVASVL